jgi:hypothetical protein
MHGGLAEISAAQCGVFTAAQAQACGFDQDETSALVRRGHWGRVRRGVYSDRPLEGLEPLARHMLEVAAALLAYDSPLGSSLAGTRPDLVAGHRSAGVFWNLPILGGERTRPGPTAPRTRPPTVELVSDDRGRRTSQFGVAIRPAPLPVDHVAVLGGLPVTSRARTAVDLARRTSPWEAVAVSDAALRAGTDPAELDAVASFCARWPGGRNAVRASAFADARAESVAESRARVLCAELGLPVPDLQVDLGDAEGWIARVDLYFRRYRTALDVDGKVKYTDPYGPPEDVIWKEKVRQERLQRAGIQVVRLLWADLENPRLVRRLVQDAFEISRRCR